jgi:NADH dehydrogenase
VQGATLGKALAVDCDRGGRIHVQPDLSVSDHPEVFVAGDFAHCGHDRETALPGIAPVAMQQGRFVGQTILGDLTGRERKNFTYTDKGQMATIGRSRAIVEVGGWHFSGLFAWVTWLVVHIYYLTGFKNRLFVVLQWAWSYLSFRRGARLIVDSE